MPAWEQGQPSYMESYRASDSHINSMELSNKVTSPFIIGFTRT
jgi:hypothetical protein